jgi:hypothetical protein
MVPGLPVALTMTGTTMVVLGNIGLAVTAGRLPYPVPSRAPPVLMIGVGIEEEFVHIGAAPLETGSPVPTEGARVAVTRIMEVTDSVIVEVPLYVSVEYGAPVGIGFVLNHSVIGTAVAVGPTTTIVELRGYGGRRVENAGSGSVTLIAVVIEPTGRIDISGVE